MLLYTPKEIYQDGGGAGLGARTNGVDGIGAGGIERTSARNPGRKRSILSCVAVQRVRCLSFR